MAEHFKVGFNYWPSNGGMYGWKRFDPEIVDQDLALLESYGTNTIRIFPLWEDFQPIKMFYEYRNAPHEVRYSNDDPLPDTFEGLCGIDPEMIRRFGVLLDLAEKHHLKVIIALLAGWMSGRLFVPPALEGRNLMTDPFAIKWEVRFIKYMVTTFRDHPAVLAWEPGNECNCISPRDKDQDYVWLHLITATIKQCDPVHPVMSGMAIDVPTDGTETIRVHGEIFDYLISHPYNLFQDKCLLDPPLSFRSIMHMSMENAINRHLSGKPAFSEEIGCLGPMYANDDVTAKFARLALYEALTQGFGGMMWWGAFDQNHFDFPPYDWDACERELGGFTDTRQPKPFAEEFKAFSQVLKQYNLYEIDMPEPEAVCILTEAQNAWHAAYGAWALARQADINLRFTVREKELPDSKLYLMPSVRSWRILPRHSYLPLLEKVKEGATLYLSMDDKVFLTEFAEVTGIDLVGPREMKGVSEFSFEGNTLHVGYRYFYEMKPLTAKVLAHDSDGNPVLFENKYGKGRVIVLNVPLETDIGVSCDKMSAPNADNFVSLYRYLAKDILANMQVKKNHRYLLKSEHPWQGGSAFVVLGNPTQETIADTLEVPDGWKLSESAGKISEATQDGQAIKVELLPGDSGILFFTE